MAAGAAAAENMRWRVLWGEIAGITELPAAGSIVIYNTAAHASQASNPPADLTNFLQLPCTLVSVQLLARQPPDYRVYARFTLRPAAIAWPGDEAVGTVEINAPERAYWKVMSRTDVQGTGHYCRLPNHIADPDGLFVLPTETGTTTNFFFMQEAQPTGFCYRNAAAGHLLSAGWKGFHVGKGLQVGDSLVFCRIDQQQVIGLSRADPYQVPLLHIQDAMASHGRNEDFVVDWYPSPGRELVVTPVP